LRQLDQPGGRCPALLSQATIAAHASQILKKLNVYSRTGIVRESALELLI